LLFDSPLASLPIFFELAARAARLLRGTRISCAASSNSLKLAWNGCAEEGIYELSNGAAEAAAAADAASADSRNSASLFFSSFALRTFCVRLRPLSILRMYAARWVLRALISSARFALEISLCFLLVKPFFTVRLDDFRSTFIFSAPFPNRFLVDANVFLISADAADAAERLGRPWRPVLLTDMLCGDDIFYYYPHKIVESAETPKARLIAAAGGGVSRSECDVAATAA